MELGKQLRALLFENFNLKILSLAFALVLYSIVHGSQDRQRSMMVTLEESLPSENANRVLVTPLPAQLRVMLRGPGSVLDDLHSDDLGAVQIDLREEMKSRVTFEPSMVHVPPGVKVEQIDPPSIDLVWEEQLTRDVPVQVGVVGAPAAGFVVKGLPAADPAIVRVRGPKSRVMVLQHARADAFDVKGLTEGKYTRALAIDRAGDHVVYDPPITSVNVTIEITREVAERTFAKVPVAVVGQTKAKTQPAEVDVRLVCPPEIVRALRAEQIVPHVQVQGNAEHGAEALPVTVTMERCEVSVTPATVVVKW